MEYQMNLFEASYEKPTLPKHIRLIEFFAGIGAQAKALEILGADFEHWRTCEWSIHSIIAYNAIHTKDWSDHSQGLSYDEVLKAIDGVSADYNKPMTDKQLRAKGENWARKIYSSMEAIHDLKPNICDVHSSDLGIADKDKNTYVMTYSFPCQDLSNAGQQKGMVKGTNTRSGLLWEVERILNECKQQGGLPQVLIMENVPAVCGSKNLKPWNDWLDSLERLGYTNYHKILNAKDYGVPQNRQRCFMVSLLGEYSFSFPKKLKLKYRLKDFIKKNVDEKYYLSDELVASFEKYNVKQAEKGNGFRFDPQGGQPSKTITTRDGQRQYTNFIEEPQMLSSERSEETKDLRRQDIERFQKTYERTPRKDGLSNTIDTVQKDTLVCEKKSHDKLLIPSATKKGYMEAKEGDGVLPTWKGARGTVQGGSSPTIMTSPDTIGVVVKGNDDK